LSAADSGVPAAALLGASALPALEARALLAHVLAVSREQLIAFAEMNQIPIAKDKRGEAPFSVDANLLHSSSEGKVLEDPAVEAPEFVHQRTLSPEDATDVATVVTIGFEPHRDGWNSRPNLGRETGYSGTVESAAQENAGLPLVPEAVRNSLAKKNQAPPCRTLPR